MKSQSLARQDTASFFSRFIGPIILVSTFVVYLLTLNGVWATDHTTAFVEFDYSVWANHTFVLGYVGSFQPGSVDVFAYHGDYFMANAPGAAFISLPFAILAFALIGHFSVWGYVLTFTEIPVALANSVAAYLVYKISSLYFEKRISAFLAFCYAFSTISWPFATYLYQSDFSAMFDLLAVYFALKIGRAKNSERKIDTTSLTLFCGLAVTAGTLVDYVNGILIPILGTYILLTSGSDSRRRITCFTSFLLESLGLTAFLLGAYNYASFGKVIVSSEQLYLNGSSLFGSFTYPLYKGVFLNLLTPMRGLFFFTPVLIFGLLGFWRAFRSSENRREIILLLAVFLGIFLPYSAWYSVTGGLSFGPRFLIAAIPFLLIPAGFVLNSKRYFLVAYVLFAIGVVENGLASMVGVLSPPGNWLDSPFLTNIFPDIIGGQSDTWWRSDLGASWFLPAGLIVAFALVFPLVCNRKLEPKENQVKLPRSI